ncbi:lipoprotein N-acyltransferase Lnb domain-containing protein [Aureibaculum conchae]|uniref:lipoprotein N-acyltransferase Lnb domain-containing protein n=1 Tax=Aureibaculum sp. 2308TA14-22 TaxID=3108392 RepID=UPI003394DE84
MKRSLFYISCLFLVVNGFAQQITLSDQAEISVITVDPGHNLYDAFGHSAFRVKDKVLNMDLAYNYGMFDFNTPNFYGKFAQGKLLYDLGAYPFSYFYKSYKEENRGIREQILNLSLSEKQAFFNFLQNNAKPENKSYLYDFFYDNCATRLKDVAKNVLKEKVEFSTSFIEGKDETLRSLIHKYANKKHPWGTFGIDLALGSVIDKKATPKDYLFLPDNIFNTYAESTINDQPLVKETKILYNTRDKGIIEFQIFTPTTLFSIFALFVFWITYRDLKRKKRSKWLDFFLFLLTGLIGTVVFLLWFATDHSATKDNYNALWAFMPNLFVAFVLLKNKLSNWVKKYVLLLLMLLVLTVLLWILKIQVFAIGILPLLIVLGIRYWFLFRYTES